MVEHCLWIFAGEGGEAKEKKIDQLAQKAFPSELKDLNTSVFHGDDKLLTPARLADAIFVQPTSGARQRLILIRGAEKLPRACLEGLEKMLSAPLAHAVVVLDTLDLEAGEALARRFQGAGASVTRFQKEKQADVFDLGRAILCRQPDEALRILGGLLRRRGERPEKIVGGLFWQWERSFKEKKISAQIYQQGVRFFADADRRLKSSSLARAGETLVLETLVVKLGYAASEACGVAKTGARAAPGVLFLAFFLF